MSPRQKNINIIHNCETLFSNWLLVRLGKIGISLKDTCGLSELLNGHDQELANLKQHIKPLRRWNKSKDDCYSLTAKSTVDEHHSELVEKTAFEGQILWLTLRED